MNASVLHLIAILFSFSAVIVTFYLIYHHLNKPLYVLLFVTLTLLVNCIGEYISTKKLNL